MLRTTRARVEQLGSSLIGSIVVGDLDAVPELTAQLSSATEHVELNVRAPHGREVTTGQIQQLSSADETARAVASARPSCEGLLLVKLGDLGPATADAVAAARVGGADAVVLVGRRNGFLANVETFAPELGSWGAYSSPD